YTFINFWFWFFAEFSVIRYSDYTILVFQDIIAYNINNLPLKRFENLTFTIRYQQSLTPLVFDSLPIQIYTAYLRTNRFTLDLFLIFYNHSEVESEISETSDLSEFDLEQLYQTPVPSPPITPPLLPPNNNNMALQAQDINNLINAIQALDNHIQNQTNAVTNNTNRLGQRETKLIEIIPFAGGNQDPVTWIEEFERMAVANNFTDARRLQIISAYLKNKVAIWYTNANQPQAFGHWNTQNQVDNQYAMRLHELYRRLETNANVYLEIKKVRKFTTGLRTELQIAVRLFGENTWDGVVNRAKTCELTRYGAAIYITPNLNNNIVTPTPTSSNSVEIIIEALNKSSVNTEGPNASQDNTNPSIMYLKEDDKNINKAYVGKKRKVVEENETPEKRNPLQGPRFHKPTIGKNVSKYSIVEDLQQIKANISIAQLAAENPKYLKELSRSLRKKKIKSTPEPM
ncbi:11863_t:CDS:2, partial [Racocetra fulgida]